MSLENDCCLAHCVISFWYRLRTVLERVATGVYRTHARSVFRDLYAQVELPPAHRLRVTGRDNT